MNVARQEGARPASARDSQMVHVVASGEGLKDNLPSVTLLTLLLYYYCW
jgi:hypothetical protein